MSCRTRVGPACYGAVMKTIGATKLTGPVPDRGPDRDTDTDTDKDSADDGYFEHERLDVYRVAREFLVIATRFLERKMTRETRDQLDRSSLSVLSNIAEGAARTARADKQRFYEFAKGSAGEAASQIDVLRIKGVITESEYAEARALLLRVIRMLTRMAGGPRTI